MSATSSRAKPHRTTCHDAAFLMLPLLLALLIGPFGLVGSALAEPAKLTGEALRQAVSGRTVLIVTAIGAVSIRYHSDGTMTGHTPALVAGLGTERDRGRWWIGDDGLCQHWHRCSTQRDSASSCTRSAPSSIGCAMTASPARPPSADR